MINPAWKKNQPVSPGPPSTIDVEVGQGVEVPCDFLNWVNVLSSQTEGDDSIMKIYVASFPNSTAVIFPPSPSGGGNWRVKEA